MGGQDDDTAVQRKAQLRFLAALPALRLQDSAERADAPGIAYHPVPEVRKMASILRPVPPALRRFAPHWVTFCSQTRRSVLSAVPTGIFDLRRRPGEGLACRLGSPVRFDP